MSFTNAMHLLWVWLRAKSTKQYNILVLKSATSQWSSYLYFQKAWFGKKCHKGLLCQTYTKYHKKHLKPKKQIQLTTSSNPIVSTLWYNIFLMEKLEFSAWGLVLSQVRPQNFNCYIRLPKVWIKMKSLRFHQN